MRYRLLRAGHDIPPDHQLQGLTTIAQNATRITPTDGICLDGSHGHGVTVGRRYFNQGYGDRDDVGRAAIWTSTDGATWIRLEASEAFQGEGYEVATDLVEGGPGLVAVGAGFADQERWGVVWASTEGVSWTRVPHDRADLPGPLAAIAAGPDGLVAVGGPGVWASGDFPIAKPLE